MLTATAVLSAADAEPLSLQRAEEAIVQADVTPGTLRQKWEPVVTLLEAGATDTQVNKPVYRLIRAHVDVFTNRNNESLRLFLETASRPELETWAKWACDVAARHPDSAIAQYFKGDAAARLSLWERAIEAYNAALKVSREHPLVLNARGVTLACRGDLDAARLDFEHAVSNSGGELADAYANVGAYRIQKKDGAQGAYDAFSKALEKSPEYAMALHGRGCVGLVLRMNESVDDLNAAMKKAPCELAKELMLRNAAKCIAKERGLDAEEALIQIKNAGMGLSLDFGFEKFNRFTPDGGSENRLAWHGGFSLGNLRMGGVLCNPAEINWDDGEWPFEHTYGLMCSASKKQQSSTTTVREGSETHGTLE